jgi:hypothetical protein
MGYDWLTGGGRLRRRAEHLFMLAAELQRYLNGHVDKPQAVRKTSANMPAALETTR